VVEVAAVVVAEPLPAVRAERAHLHGLLEPHDRVDDEGAPVARLLEAAEAHLPGLLDLLRVVLDLDHVAHVQELGHVSPKPRALHGVADLLELVVVEVAVVVLVEVREDEERELALRERAHDARRQQELAEGQRAVLVEVRPVEDDGVDERQQKTTEQSLGVVATTLETSANVSERRKA